MLLTAALLSLGAPIWYELLANLINLRSLVTQRDDQQRKDRQTNQAPSVPLAAPGGGAG